MTTERQIAANRRNAAKSTGPRSTAGKEMARMNALKHGLQAEHFVIPGEDPDEFEAHFRSLEEYYQPVGPVESGLVERITYCTWCLRRSRRIETAIMREQHVKLQKDRADDVRTEISNAWNYGSGECDLEEPEPEDESAVEAYATACRAWEKARKACEKIETELQDPGFSLAIAFRRSTKDLEMLSRYETTLERRLRNAMQDLERVQAVRKIEAAEAATVIDITDLNQDES